MRARLPALGVAAALILSADARAAVETAARTLDRLGPSVVAVHFTLRPAEAPEEGGQGDKVEGVQCGVVVEGGLVVTTADVFAEPDADPRQTLVPIGFMVRDADGREVALEPAGLDRTLNLAFLRPVSGEPLPLPGVRFSERAPRPGEPVLLIGLLGEPFGYRPTFSSAHVAVELDRPQASFALDALVQDLTIGGLVTTPKGEALGIVGEDVLPASPANAGDLAQSGNVLSLFASLSQGRRPGYPVLFPWNGTLAPLVRQPPPVEASDVAHRGWLGIIMQPLSRDLAEYWKVPGPGGVVIGSVLGGSPAERGGLQVGDIIIEVDGRPVEVREQKDLTRFRELVQATGVGREVPLAVFRAGHTEHVTLTLGASPKTVFLAEERKDRDFGLTVKELTFDVLQVVNLPADTRGVLVAEVENAGWADVGGLGVNDIIQEIHGTQVADLAGFDSVMARIRTDRPKEVIFFVRRGSRTLFIPIRTDW